MIRARTLISIAVALALVLALMPTMALAAEDSAGGTFTLGNAAPTSVTVALWDTSGPAAATAMDPQVEFNVKVTVTDTNTLDDLDTITVTIYYDADGTYDVGQVPVGGNVNTAAILTWTNDDPDTWEIDATSGAGSWSIVSGSCAVPGDLTTMSTGTFEFHFIPGAVATETAGSDEWHIYAVADDGAATSDGYQEDRTMNWYGAVAISEATIAFGSVTLGVEDDQSPNFVLTSIANGDYKLNLKADATWTGDVTTWELSLDTGDENPGDAELALEADDDGTEADAQLVTDAYLLYTGHATDSGPTPEAGTDVGTNTLWLSLGSTGIVADDYSGTIYYQILND
jgi:hypothetical protein